MDFLSEYLIEFTNFAISKKFLQPRILILQVFSDFLKHTSKSLFYSSRLSFIPYVRQSVTLPHKQFESKTKDFNLKRTLVILSSLFVLENAPCYVFIKKSTQKQKSLSYQKIVVTFQVIFLDSTGQKNTVFRIRGVIDMTKMLRPFPAQI